MNRALAGAVGGAAIGFLLGYAVVQVAAGGEVARDTAAISLFVGSVLAGPGAIAGAVVGGVADLCKFIRSEHDAKSQERGE